MQCSAVQCSVVECTRSLTRTCTWPCDHDHQLALSGSGPSFPLGCTAHRSLAAAAHEAKRSTLVTGQESAARAAVMWISLFSCFSSPVALCPASWSVQLHSLPQALGSRRHCSLRLLSRGPSRPPLHPPLPPLTAPHRTLLVTPAGECHCVPSRHRVLCAVFARTSHAPHLAARPATPLGEKCPSLPSACHRGETMPQHAKPCHTALCCSGPWPFAMVDSEVHLVSVSFTHSSVIMYQVVKHPGSSPFSFLASPPPSFPPPSSQFVETPLVLSSMALEGSQVADAVRATGGFIPMPAVVDGEIRAGGEEGRRGGHHPTMHACKACSPSPSTAGSELKATSTARSLLSSESKCV